MVYSGSRLRIALLAPLVSPIAPPFLGGAQALLYDLAAGLAARGHRVTLFAAAGSGVPGVTIAPQLIDFSQITPALFTGPTPASAVSEVSAADQKLLSAGAEQSEDVNGDIDLAEPERDVFLSGYAFMEAYRQIARRADEFDLVHAHAYDWPAFAHASIQPLPIVHTLHLPAIDPQITHLLGVLAPVGIASSTRLVTVSHACAATYASTCRIDAVMYNGVDLANIPFSATSSATPYLLYAGRITPEKGVEDALEIAARGKRRLVLAGGVYDQDYFDLRIAPRLQMTDNPVEYLGALTRDKLWDLMADAAAVLCPAQWDEPFGLVACEALATGTPVVGYARGGLREVVTDGVTGWLVAPNDVTAAVAAVRRVGEIDRTACRTRVEQHFSLTAMLDAYEEFYCSMLAI